MSDHVSLAACDSPSDPSVHADHNFPLDRADQTVCTVPSDHPDRTARAVHCNDLETPVMELSLEPRPLGIFRRIDISSEFRRYIPRKFRGNQILCFLGISSEIPRDILRISFSVGMSVIGMYVGVATVGVFIIWYTHSSFMGIDLSQDGHSLVSYSQLAHWG
ncbi:hypothetical protein F2Q69_00058326 [Brassica cretica]|uniref:Uncharacterized protein n=1 Tax=Brassica cretica TaxID=69181 RepID=A0A8S9RAV7_BRACR|nr:hypothetical protein F2Q69_00058326 [Brassica cretica]